MIASIRSDHDPTLPRIDVVTHEKASTRAEVFQHLSGLVLIPTVNALWRHGVLPLLQRTPDWASWPQILESSQANPGYMRVALRLLVASGWLRQRVFTGGYPNEYSLTPEGRIALELAPDRYENLARYLSNAVSFASCLLEASQPHLVAEFRDLVIRAKGGWGLEEATDAMTARVHRQIQGHLTGALVGPAMVALSRGGILDRLIKGPVRVQSTERNAALLGAVFDLLTVPGWVSIRDDAAELTSAGTYAAQIAPSYGVTVSYLANLNSLETLLFGNPRALRRVDDKGVELLVDRAMNVWGSGGAHATYFKKVDEIVVELFNRPLDRQPKGICDMGCGDATFLEHLYFTIKTRTARGRVLDSHPLILVGADYNKVARQASKRKLRRAAIPNYHVIPGDINRPAQLAAAFEKLGLDIHDFFHARSFLDHNRPYLPPAGYVKGSRPSRSTGAFALLGNEIGADEMEENLVQHMRRWAPYIGRFGALILELHTLPPELTAANLEKTPAVAYDGTHGYSDQYLVELPVFLSCLLEAGLVPDTRFQAKFPPSELATVSINLFTAAAS